jgi:hypothetical protein
MVKIRTLRVIGLIIFLVIVAVLLITRITEGIKGNEQDALNDLPSTRTITNDDSNVISPQYLRSIKPQKNENSKSAAPVSFLLFEDSFHLVVHKINLLKDQSLNEILLPAIKASERSNGISYRVFNFNGFSRFQWRGNPSIPVSRIYFNLDGDSLTNEIKNDSIYSYHLLCNTLAIKYTKDGPIDIYMEGEHSTLWSKELTPLDILFLKKDKCVYLMLMTPLSRKSAIPPLLLYNLVTGGH